MIVNDQTDETDHDKNLNYENKKVEQFFFTLILINLILVPLALNTYMHTEISWILITLI